jgi:hypothetical protein
VPPGALSLRGVLQHRDAGGVRDPDDLLHRRRLPVKVHRDDRLGPRAQFFLYCVDVDQRGVLHAVDEHRDGAGAGDSFGRGDERVRRQHALITWPDAECPQRELERVGAVGDPDAMAHSGVLGELRLERGHLGAADERRRLEDFGPTEGHLVGHLVVLCGQVHQWNNGGGGPPLGRR